MKRNGTFPRLSATVLAVLGLMLLLPVAASASTTGETMPWDQGLTVIMNAVQGPTALIIGTIMIVGAGFAIAFTEGRAVKMLLFVVVGVGIALDASKLLLTLFPQASGYELQAIAPASRAIVHVLAAAL